MDHPEITKLYKYYADKERVIEILKTERIWYSKPERFNDPFDCDIDIASNVTWDQFAEIVRVEGKQLNKSPAEIEEKIRAVRSESPAAIDEYRARVREGVERVRDVLRGQGVLSLSSIPDSIPMWGYYANGHRGMCIEFHRAARNALGSSATREVHYTSDYPDVSFLDLFKRPGYLSKTVMRTKSRAWKHEKEWRVVLTNGDILYDLPGEITGVFFGLSTPEEHKREVAELVKDQDGIMLLQAIKVKGRFRMEFVDYAG